MKTIFLCVLCAVCGFSIPGYASDIDLRGAEPQVATKIRALTLKVRQNSTSADAWGKLAMNLHIHDFRQEAITTYTQASKLEPDKFRWKYLRAVALQEIGSPESLRALREAVRMKNEYIPVRLRLAQTLMDAEKTDAADDEYQAVLKYDSRCAHAYLGLSRIALAKGDLGGSAKHASKALQLNPNLAEAHGILADIYRRHGFTEKMINELKLSQTLPQKLAPADPVLWELVREGVSAYWYETRGRALLQQQQYAAAVGELQKAARARPDARIYDLLGIAYQAQNKHREALAEHRKAVELKPDSAESWNNLGSAYASAGDLPKAIECLEKALKLATGQGNVDLQKNIDSNLRRYLKNEASRH